MPATAWYSGCCLERFGRIDVLVNNAGTSAVTPLEELTDEDWQAQWELHVMAPMRLMRALAPGDGRARVGADRQRLLVLGQAAVADQRRLLGDQGRASSRSPARSPTSYAAAGVLINAVAPGPVASELWMAAGRPGRPERRGPGHDARGDPRVDGRRAFRSDASGTAEEIAAVIVFLCSEAASNVAGAAWSVDGGSVPVII